MLKEDLQKMRQLIRDYGPQEMLSSFIQTLQDEADDLSDLNLKEKAIELVSMSETLRMMC